MILYHRRRVLYVTAREQASRAETGRNARGCNTEERGSPNDTLSSFKIPQHMPKSNNVNSKELECAEFDPFKIGGSDKLSLVSHHCHSRNSRHQQQVRGIGRHVPSRGALKLSSIIAETILFSPVCYLRFVDSLQALVTANTESFMLSYSLLLVYS